MHNEVGVKLSNPLRQRRQDWPASPSRPVLSALGFVEYRLLRRTSSSQFCFARSDEAWQRCDICGPFHHFHDPFCCENWLCGSFLTLVAQEEPHDERFAIMPFDPRLQYRDEVTADKGGKTGRLKTRWEKVVQVLSRKIETTEDFIVRLAFLCIVYPRN